MHCPETYFCRSSFANLTWSPGLRVHTVLSSLLTVKLLRDSVREQWAFPLSHHQKQRTLQFLNHYQNQLAFPFLNHYQNLRAANVMGLPSYVIYKAMDTLPGQNFAISIQRRCYLR